MSVAHQQIAASQSAAHKPYVVILMGLRDGGRWLGPQLDSIARQRHSNWSLIISDDGSCDDGPVRAARFAAGCAPGVVQVRAGPCAGFARNYLSMLASVPPTGDVVVFCDQDDVWLPDRLTRACAALDAGPAEVPALYLSTTWIASEDLTRRKCSRGVARGPSFANALVQCVGGGNTMAVNRAGLRLLRAAVPEVLLATGGRGPASHDWWMYQMITGAGGRVVADVKPSLFYRQHGGNLSGSNRGLRALGLRAWQLLRGRARRMTDRNLAALKASEHRLTSGNRHMLRRFDAARDMRAVARLRAVRSLGLHRQRRIGTGALYLAALLGLV